MKHVKLLCSHLPFCSRQKKKTHKKTKTKGLHKAAPIVNYHCTQDIAVCLGGNVTQNVTD